MKYCLVVYNNDNIEEIKGYTLLPGFEDFDSYSLKDILDFTMHFDDESDLKSFLIANNLIPKEYQTRQIGIAYYKNSKASPSILKYGVPFSYDKEFYKSNYLRNYLISNTQDVFFMAAFLEEFYSYLINVPIYNNSLNNLAYGYNYLKKTGKNAEYYTEAMQDFFENYTLKRDKAGKYKRNTLAIHKLAIFISHYLKNLEPEEPNLDALTIELHHFQTVLSDGNITDEQRTTYEERISELEKQLEQKTRKREKHDTTEN